MHANWKEYCNARRPVVSKQTNAGLPKNLLAYQPQLFQTTKVINEDPRQSSACHSYEIIDPFAHWRTQQNLSLNNEHHLQQIIISHHFPSLQVTSMKD